MQIFSISWVTFLCLKIDKEALNAWLCVVAISLNLFILKQVNLFGMDVNTTKALGVCYMLGLNLMQEYYGKRAARMHVMIAAICTFGFVILQQIHIFFIPNVYDTTQANYAGIFSLMPLVTSISFIAFIFIQLLDIRFFSWLQEKIGAKNLTLRVVISLMMSQIVDVCVVFGLLSFFDPIW